MTGRTELEAALNSIYDNLTKANDELKVILQNLGKFGVDYEDADECENLKLWQGQIEATRNAV